MRLYVTKELMKVGWQKNHNSLVWEMSEINDCFTLDADDFVKMIKTRSQTDEIEVINKDTGNFKVFHHSHNDVVENEIQGYNYVSDNGMKLLLIND